MSTHPYKYVYTYLNYMSTSERLSWLDLEIHKVITKSTSMETLSPTEKKLVINITFISNLVFKSEWVSSTTNNLTS
jgi:hypothetical protein